jgi:hypothetical protein
MSFSALFYYPKNPISTEPLQSGIEKFSNILEGAELARDNCG